MKQVFYNIAILMLTILFTTSIVNAQKKDTTIISKDNVKIIVTKDKSDTTKKKRAITVSIGNHGIKITDKNKKRPKKHKKLHVGMHFDFGFNNINDKTNYVQAQSNGSFLSHDTAMRLMTKDDISLQNGKSINFNFWPLWLKQDIAKHNVQFETGLGFQFFNYRYGGTVKHQSFVTNGIIAPRSPFDLVTDPNQLEGKAKNKLGISYVSIPLMLRFNTNKKKGHRYFVGAGFIGSYKLKSWTKFYGQKESGDFGFNDWMGQVTAEIGVTSIIKLYGTYALQSTYRGDMLDRTPFVIGIRL